MDKIKSLIAKRGVIKGKLTRFADSLNSLSANEIKLRYDRIKPLLDQFESIQDEIEILSDEERENSVQRETFENQYFSVLATAKGAIMSIEQGRVEIKLPTLQLREFDGNQKEWVNFVETFKTLVHNNSSLSNVQKFFYLQSTLKGNALKIIANLEVSELNYLSAWELLHDRFANLRATVHKHIQTLFQLKDMKHEEPVALRYLIDETNVNLKALQNIGVKVDQWDPLIIYIISNKLDVATRKNWEQYTLQGELPTLKEFMKCLSTRAQVLELMNVSEKKYSNLHKTQIGNNNNKKDSSVFLAVKANNCIYCNENGHQIYFCKKFLKLKLQDRIDATKSIRACFKCLRLGHQAQSCKTNLICKICGKYSHNTLLHREVPPPETSNMDANNEVIVSNFSASEKAEKIILLSTAYIGIVGANNKMFKARALIDSGAQSNFMRAEFANKLNLPCEWINKPVSGIHNNITHIKRRISVEMTSLNTDYKCEISCLILQEITTNLPQVTMAKKEFKLPPGLELADPNFNIAAPIDILLGAESFWEMLSNDRLKLESGPTLQRTQLGWIVSGPINVYPKQRPVSDFCSLSINKLSHQIEKFWKLEEINSTKIQTQEEKACEASFVNTHTREDDGRYVVSLPRRACIDQLGNSLLTAEKRFKNMERKFVSHPELKTQYVKFMREYEELGHMEVCDQSKGDRESYFLPHHAVVKESSTTTKVRVVFDGSAKTSNGISLNEALMTGPVIQKDLYNQLLHFRKHQIVMTADIEKMYRQINMCEDDLDLQKIVWRESPQDVLKHYRLKTVTYGLAPSSFLATRCLKQIGMDNNLIFPSTSRVIENDFYMDDLLTGADELESCKKLKEELISILSSAGMTLRKWRSNALELSAESGQAKCADSDNSDKIITDNPKTEKILGLTWNNESDYFSYVIMKPSGPTESKREILSCIASTFDPLGLLGPIIVIAKLIMQRLWQSKAAWDDQLNNEILAPWRTYLQDLIQLNVLKIPRKIICKQAKELQLHGFCDSSEKAFGACIYMVSMDHSGKWHSHLITSKSRVAPLKCISLPKLELCSAVLLAKLMKTIKQALNIMEINTYYWCDSTIALCWLKGQPTRWSTFVANRVAEIQELSDPDQWRHVSSSDNAADVLSRGTTADKLINSTIWWNGPSWLTDGVNDWPISNISCSNPPELKSKNILLSTDIQEWEIFGKFSSFIKLKRVTAYVLRFVNNCRNIKSKISGNLSVAELEASLNYLLKSAQAHAFHKELKTLKNQGNVNKDSNLKSLHPFLRDGLIHVGGRLNLATHLSYQQRHPIILPAKHKLTELIIRHYHYVNLHAGPQALLAEIRLKFWPIFGKNTVKKILHKCIVCFRCYPRTGNQIMGNLPSERITPSRPFAVTGVDFAGPIPTKSGPLRKAPLVKSYLCIFVCFSTKAVHLELVSDLSSNAFLNSLKRFISRRGEPDKIFSDNASNFRGACNRLKELYTSLRENNDKIQNYLANRGIEWRFITPRAPSQGGLWEAAVKSAKFHLYRVTNNSALTFELLYTLICQIEACLNSRPLTSLSDDIHDYQPLTPNHFLIGTKSSIIPERDVRAIPDNRLTQYQRIHALMLSFWSRWKREYLMELQKRTKWQTSNQRALQKDDLVILKEDNSPPPLWKMARVICTHPGADGVVRVVTLKTPQGIFVRPITKICLMPLDPEAEPVTDAPDPSVQSGHPGRP